MELALDGVFPSAYIRANSLIASSCLTCDRYLRYDKLWSYDQVLKRLTVVGFLHLVYPLVLQRPGSRESWHLQV